MKDFVQLNEHHILITGAGSGIGRQTAVSLSEYGARLSLIDLNEDGLNKTLEMLSGSGHKAYQMDLSEIEIIEGRIKDIVAEQGPFDGYVQCAGITMTLPLNTIKYEKLDFLMKVNFYSFFELIRVLSRKGRYNAGMSIVGISSTAAECAVPAQASYSASKAAMNGVMRSAARELAQKGIRINTILPGPTKTEMYLSYLETKADTKGDIQENKHQLNYLGDNEPEDVANAIMFLLSKASRKVTGVAFPVDAGYTSC